jgi:hypothetical protein
VFHIWRFFLSVKKLFHLMNEMLQTTPSYLFWFVRYRCLNPCILFGGHYYLFAWIAC